MIKDAGYYYENFDTTRGSSLMVNALRFHDEIKETYDKKTKQVLFRYQSNNTELVNTYKKLIENVFEPGKHALSNEYNWKTNLYK